MTNQRKPWRAEVPLSYSISGNVQWNRAFDERAVFSLVFCANEELDRIRALLDERDKRIAELEAERVKWINAYNEQVRLMNDLLKG